MKKEMFAHQETISILSQEKEAQIKFYKTHEDKEIDEVISLENKVKVLDNIVYKTGQTVQIMNMLNQEMVADLRYFNSLELEVDSLKSQMETQKTQFLNEIDRFSREYYYADHMNVILGVIPSTSNSRPQLKSTQMKDRVMLNNSQGKKQELEDHHRNVNFSKNKTFVTACNDSLNTKTSNDNFVCVTCGKCVLNDNHDRCVLHYLYGVNSRTKMPIAMPISTREPKRTLVDIILFIVDSVMREVGFRKSTCYIRDLKGNDILTGSRGTDLYSITLQDTSSPDPIYLMGKATSSQAWLWHRHLSHLNFDTINLLSMNDIVIGLPKLKFVKDHLCSSWYSTQSRAYRVFIKRTRVIVETIHVNFDELPQMASNHISSDPVPQCQRTALEHDSLSLGHQCQENVPHAAGTVTMSNELDLLYSPMLDELLNGSTQVVSKSSAVTTSDAPNQCQKQHATPLNTQTTPKPTCQVLTLAPTATSTENINQAETLESDGEMCMFALTVSRTEPKNIKEAMDDSAWIKSMQEELH
uniref:Integrase, catalytic region, zinc finger, CCHC-type, peptidase aspartic, catalytic n=1 Tax=Tanacetum cinerariifolium TaxID=118510 RepID=A0A6L2P0R4_TANCI|nr:integrase, catalytic region, zinc finger, CCHC-type, peptidase aspartic, catalytic [Tanacetum cinerariifolium]